MNKIFKLIVKKSIDFLCYFGVAGVAMLGGIIFIFFLASFFVGICVTGNWIFTDHTKKVYNYQQDYDYCKALMDFNNTLKMENFLKESSLEKLKK